MITRTHILVSMLLAGFLLTGCKREEQPAAPESPETAPRTTVPEEDAQPDEAAPETGPAVEAEREPAPAEDATPPVPDDGPVRAAVARARKEGVRAVWVTRTQFKTPEDIARVMQNAQDAGFNTVVFQVRGNGTVFYPSKLEPWAEQYSFQDPGFDPLAVALQEARSRGLALQAWVNVMPAWRGTRPPSHPDQLYHQRPEWFWYDQKGQRQALSDFYVSLNPCLPEVRTYLVDVFREIVANYEIDALHMDYIRFPNEPPAIPARSGLDYPRDARTLALYKEATGKAPDDDQAAWNKWRTDQVTRLVADIRNMIRQVRPACLLTASVGANYKSSLSHFQDSPRWVEESLIDMAFPMNYKRDLPSFVSSLEAWLPLRDRVMVIPGLWTPGGPDVVKGQIQAAVAATGHFCLFSYGNLFDPPPEPQTRPAATAPAATAPARRSGGRRARQARQERENLRNEVIPAIKAIAASRPTL